MTTGAKMVLHDWQRGRIPFFVPPTQKDDIDATEEAPVLLGTDISASARKNIADIVSSQQLIDIPEQKDFFDASDLKDAAVDSIEPPSPLPSSSSVEIPNVDSGEP